MSAMLFLGYIVVGGAVGVMSGLLGIGGGVLVIPLLTLLFHYTHQRAVGTSLGMLLPPIGVFAFLTYYRANQADIVAAAILAAGFALGGFLGGVLANQGIIPEVSLRKLFAFFLLYYAGTLLFKSDGQVWSVVKTLSMMAVFGAGALGCRVIGRNWDRTFSLKEVYQANISAGGPHDYEI